MKGSQLNSRLHALYHLVHLCDYGLSRKRCWGTTSWASEMFLCLTTCSWTPIWPSRRPGRCIREKLCLSKDSSCKVMAVNKHLSWLSKSKVAPKGTTNKQTCFWKIIISQEGTSSNTAPTIKQMCTKYGKQKHYKGVGYPAKDAVFHKCNHKGHYSSQLSTPMSSTWTLHSWKLWELTQSPCERPNYSSTRWRSPLNLIQVQKSLLSLRRRTRNWAYQSYNSHQKSCFDQQDRHIQRPQSIHSHIGVPTPHNEQYLSYVDMEQPVGTSCNYLSPTSLLSKQYRCRGRHVKAISQGVFRSGQPWS